MGIEELLEELKNKTTLGKKIEFYYKDTKQYYELGEVVDEVSVISTDSKDYKHFVQKIRYPDGNIGYRFCYFVINKKKTGVIFGQYASAMNSNDFRELMRKAKEKEFF